MMSSLLSRRRAKQHRDKMVRTKSSMQSDNESAPHSLSLVQEDERSDDSTLVERGEAICAVEEQEPAAALHTLPDDLLMCIVGACGAWLIGVPEHEAVSALGILCKDVLQQLYRLQPLVGVKVRRLPALKRLTRGPWRIVLLYTGEPTAEVVEEAWKGHVRSIDARRTTLTPAVARRVVPELLGAGSSLHVFGLSHVKLNGRWTTTFGQAAVCSTALLELQLDACGLSGPVPELSLPALQILWMSNNQMTGGLEPLLGCTALQERKVVSSEHEGRWGAAPLDTLHAPVRCRGTCLTQHRGGLLAYDEIW